MKLYLLCVLVVLSNFGVLAQGIALQVGPSFDDISNPGWSDRDYNARKIGAVLRLSYDHPVWKGFGLSHALRFNRRENIEYWEFMDDPNLRPDLPGVGIATVGRVPTNPQSHNWDAARYNHLKPIISASYDLLITYTFKVSKQIELQLGAGGFGSYVLNHKQLLFKPSDLGIGNLEELAYFTQLPPNEPLSQLDVQIIPVQFRKYDLGLTGRVSVTYHLNDKLNLALSSGYQLSDQRIVQNSLFQAHSSESKWQSFDALAGVTYVLGKRKAR